MTTSANQRAIRSIMRKSNPPEELNILTFATHERYEENLCKTGHNFYSLAIGKTWDTDYAPVPDNYHIIDAIPDHIDFDLILTHTSCDRMFKAHQHLAGSDVTQGNKTGIPILRHTHVLPDARFDVPSQVVAFRQYPRDKDSFISAYNMAQWEAADASVVLLEAMACGCAIVSTANCMIPEIIENGKNGLISNDPQELRGFLDLLLKNEDLAKELGANARKTIVEKYNLKRFTDNWNKLFYSTINSYRNK